jgi:hypothetical protein
MNEDEIRTVIESDERIAAIAQEIAQLGYDLHVNQSKGAEARLGQLRQERCNLGEAKETLLGAIDGLRKRSALAQNAIALTDAAKRCKRVCELLVALQECATQLDVCAGDVVKVQAWWRIDPGPKNPPLIARVGDIVANIFVELKALGLDHGVVWPPRLWGLADVEDFRRDFMTMAQRYSGRFASSRRNLVEAIEGWADNVRAAVLQHEQTNREKTDAAA